MSLGSSLPSLGKNPKERNRKKKKRKKAMGIFSVMAAGDGSFYPPKVSRESFSMLVPGNNSISRGINIQLHHFLFA